ncbi:MAG: hypothetical protein GVY19_03720 [Bacteroidetes bacterium]|jgi:hypothetical protein|nr:hypothetical protein [Bacteroidota bacterium]
MKIILRNFILTVLPVVVAMAVLSISLSCSETDNPISDAQKLAALRKVTITMNGMDYEFIFPEGALDGESFEELMKKDSSKYADRSNYTIAFTINSEADNTADGARDAKFDGMFIDLIFDTITSSPVRTEAGAFEIEANSTREVPATGSINLETHNQAGLYIFRQTVDGNDLKTTFSPVLLYNIGTLEDELALSSVTLNIPTRASDETKAFLRDLLESGILEE